MTDQSPYHTTFINKDKLATLLKSQAALRGWCARYRREIEEQEAALETSMVAIDDWLNTYASELCDPGRVQEATTRIRQYGTIGYIAHVQEINRAAMEHNNLCKLHQRFPCRKCGVQHFENCECGFCRQPEQKE